MLFEETNHSHVPETKTNNTANQQLQQKTKTNNTANQQLQQKTTTQPTNNCNKKQKQTTQPTNNCNKKQTKNKTNKKQTKTFFTFLSENSLLFMPMDEHTQFCPCTCCSEIKEQTHQAVWKTLLSNKQPQNSTSESCFYFCIHLHRSKSNIQVSLLK